MDRIALIPAYEPDGQLLPLLRALGGAGFHRVVVDDGSGGAYAEIFSGVPAGVTVLTHCRNRGKGRALKTGLDYIQSHFPRDSAVVTVDADGQHTAKDALRCVQAAEQHPGSLVLGCRTFSRGVPQRSRLGNRITRFVCRTFSGLRLSDTQTGLRAFTADLIPLLADIEGDRYEYEMNVLLACGRRGIPLAEVPIATIYRRRNAGSHFRTVRDSWLIYRSLLGGFAKFAGSSLASFLLDYGLYSLLVTVSAPLGAPSVPLSNITARIVSAGFNFTVNRTLVFRSRKNPLRAAAQYALLAACILAGNTLLLSWMVGVLGANRFAAKLVTEAIFFTLSWAVQKLLIFRQSPERS
ncbi:MAG: bifunctional glycosyltransferase family 2/GtrA family protein [Oscillibacter sp.]|nr:bifunctional glycosyltransferase family 2/GtrA family protein [Oscillibacter sp.]